MPASALALVVAAAVLHALWNVLAKRGQDQLAFLWSSVLLSTLWLLPLAASRLWADGVAREAWPFVAVTVVLHALYFYALGRSYRAAEFSLVYPVMRGLGVALVPLFAWILLDERLSPIGIAGIILVVLGILGLHLRAPRGGAPSPARLAASGSAWALLTGLTIAAYSLVDKAGVARLHPLPYIWLMGVGMCALLLPVVLATPGVLRREWARNGRAILVASTMNLTSYLLVLFAFRLSKAGYVVAARELSIVLSVFIGSLWLGEGRLGPRLAGAAVILAGVVCVALAR